MGLNIGAAGTGATAGATAGASFGLPGALIGGVAGGLFGLFSGDPKKDQLEVERELLQQQLEGNKELANYTSGLQKDMFDYTSAQNYKYATAYADKYNTPQAIVKNLKEAGLNPALAFGGMGGVGGQSVSGTTGSVSAGSAGKGTAATAAQMEQVQLQKLGMGLQIAKLKSEVDVNESIAKKNLADAENLSEKTTTEVRQRDALIEKLYQEGQKTWLENVRDRYRMENTGAAENEMTLFGNKIYTSVAIQKQSIFTQEVTSAILKTQAEEKNALASALLNNERAQGYYQELLNATAHADADKAKAAAVKLATEWSTGEYTNWKTWVDTAAQGVNMLSDVISGVAKVKKLGK